MRSNALILLLLLLLLTGAAVASPQDEEAIRRSVDQAIQLAQAGRIDEAIRVLEEQGRESGLPAPALGLLGALYLDAGEPQRALELLRPLAGQSEASALVLVSAARAAFAVGDVAAAEEFMGRAAEVAPDSEAARRFGLYLGKQGRFAEAYEVLAPYVEARSDDDGAALALATAALKIGRTDAAAAALDRVPESNPGAILLRGELALQRGEPHRALELFERAWGSHPPELDRDLRRLLAETYLATGRADAVRELFDAAAIEDPTTGLLLSRALYQAGEIEAAAETLGGWADTVRRLPAGSSESEVALAVGVATEYARALVALGRAEEAEALLRDAVRRMPEAAEAWNVLGHALIATGKMDEAREAVGRYHHLSEGPPAGGRGNEEADPG